MNVTIYHNPECGTSRNTLRLIRNAGLEPHVIEYLKAPPTRALLQQLIERTGVPIRTVIREKGTPFKELGLDDPALSDDALLDAMVAHPILINRPIVVTETGAKLCRPSEIALDLLPEGQTADFDKEDGSAFLSDTPIEPTPEMVGALRSAQLPIDDLRDPGRSFFRYATLGGSPVGFGGFELYGSDVLLRSMVVLPEMRGRGIGRNAALLLMRRAFDQGARNAYVLTTTAAPFFAALGFKPIDRDDAPTSIRSTRQASSLCPSSAALLAKRITL